MERASSDLPKASVFGPLNSLLAGRRSGVKKSDRRMCFGYRVGSVLGLATDTGSAVRVASGYIRRMARKPRSRGDSVVPARRMMADMPSVELTGKCQQYQLM